MIFGRTCVEAFFPEAVQAVAGTSAAIPCLFQGSTILVVAKERLTVAGRFRNSIEVVRLSFKRRSRIAFLVAIFGICLISLRMASFNWFEPEYQGQSLSEWLGPTFQWDGSTYQGMISTDFERAMQAMGTNTIPYLIRMLRTRELPGTSVLLRVRGNTWNDPLIAGLHLNFAMVRRQRAVHGFRALGSLATNAVPELLKLALGNAARETDVWRSLDGIGQSALPQMKEALESPKEEIRVAAILALAQPCYDFKRETIVDLWCECFNDPSSRVRRTAARCIGGASAVRARGAIAALEKAAQDPSSDVAWAAQTALNSIRPRN